MGGKVIWNKKWSVLKAVVSDRSIAKTQGN